MKNFTIVVLLLLLAFTISSCKKDDPTEDVTELIVGKRFFKKNYEVVTRNGQKTETTDTNFGNEDYLEFKKDGTGKYSEVGDTDNFTYKITGNNILTLYYDGDDAAEEPVEITLLNSTDFVILYKGSEIYEGITKIWNTETTFKK